MAEDVFEDILKELRQIRYGSQDIDGQTPLAGSGISFVSARDAVVVTNEEWVDDSVNALSPFSDIVPGDAVTVAKMEAFGGELVGFNAVAVSSFAYDVDGDGENENALEYEYQIKKRNGDSWNTLQGLTTTVPFGVIGEGPTELIPGLMIGPVAGARIRFRNRTDETANQVTIDGETIAGELHGVVVR